MGDFFRIQLDANNEEIVDDDENTSQEPEPRAATQLDVNEYNRQAREALDFYRDDRILQLSNTHDAKVAQYVELEDRVAAIQRGGQRPHPSLLEQLERMRHDILIIRDDLEAYVKATGTPGGLGE